VKVKTLLQRLPEGVLTGDGGCEVKGISHDSRQIRRGNVFAAKCRPFSNHMAADGCRVLPVDDPWGARLLDQPRDGDASWGLDRGTICARDVVSDLNGSCFDLRIAEEQARVELPLAGVHNLRNALSAAAAAAHVSGLGITAIRRGFKRARPLSGRLEPVRTALKFPVFAVGELADLPIVTSDNPRMEDPGAIAEAVAEGVRTAGAEPLVVLDRSEAIGVALEKADERSLVLVAGKGHEPYQLVGETRIPFSDQNVLRSEARGARCA
jgi:UDP-N-acetylmuramoyl-L-alanyl-D-glutamate--2,6-diaminopimelate ligase